MKTDSGHTSSYWMDTADTPAYRALQQDARCDVCIVGAGIAGMTTAYHLARAGKKVIVVDDGPIAGGETGRTTAHLTAALDDRFYSLEALFGTEGARLAAASHTAAIERYESIAKQEQIDCDFRWVDGYLFLGKDDDPDALRKELDATHRAGLGTRLLDRAPLEFWNTGPCLRFPRQAQLHPLKFLSALADCITRDGGRIYTSTHVKEIKAGSPCNVVMDGDNTITCTAVVVATNTPVNDYVVMHTKQAPYRTFVIACRIPKDSVPYALYWDTPDPYHYVRLQPAADNAGEDVLIVGGEDHKTGQKDDGDNRFRCLFEWTRQRFPMVQRINWQWSGQVMEPVDYMGYIGRDAAGQENVYVATGDSGNGMTHGMIAGMLLGDLITGKPNEWSALYDPARKTVKVDSAVEYLKENVNVAVQYADYVKPKPGVVDSPDEIERGEGSVLRRGTHIIAAYRDMTGTLHERSAVCTHLKCIVHWNSTEKTWDCPCHGSRFTGEGKVVNGPAIGDLEKVEGSE
ncbi:MAG TPA: FAD-dependent oxidoreductase [Gemmatimonadaceae bacterium]|nr:FAD-dependent oxidoreductase [Gemmatimonadaceae bacterium]